MIDRKQAESGVSRAEGLARLAAIISAISVGVLGILFIGATLHLYFTGGAHPYSRERVGQYLSPLILPTVVTVGVTVWSYVMTSLAPKNKEKGTPLPESHRLYNLVERLKGCELDTETSALVNKERRRRLIFNIGFTALSVIFASVALIYAIFFAELTVKNLNGDILALFSITLPLFAIAVGLHAPRLYLNEMSAAREREALAAAVKNGVKPTGTASPRIYKNEGLKRNVLTALFAVAAVVFIIVGAFNGGMDDVLAKAVKICTECIGLG